MREIVTISKRFIDIKYDKPFGFKRSYRAFIFLSLGAKTAEHLTLIKANLKKVQLGLAVEPAAVQIKIKSSDIFSLGLNSTSMLKDRRWIY